MDKSGPTFLAFLLLLAMAITGPDIVADARQVERKVPFVAEAAPLNLSANSTGILFEVSKEPTANVASTNSVEQHFDAPINDTSANVREERQEVELLPGFDVINNLVTRSQGIHVQCWNNVLPPWNQPIIVDQIVPPGLADGWDLQVIDPENQHFKYRCRWQLAGTEPLQEITHEAWVDLSNQYGGRMPFYCVRCTWKLSDDGLYLYNLNWQLFVKVSDWNVDGPEEEA